ncbi:hypothetical protein D3C73_1443590 [compost metagenome]
MDRGFDHHFDPDQAVADIIMQLAGDPYPFLGCSCILNLCGELQQPVAGLVQFEMLFAQLVIQKQGVFTAASCPAQQLIQPGREKEGEVHIGSFVRC